MIFMKEFKSQKTPNVKDVVFEKIKLKYIYQVLI